MRIRIKTTKAEENNSWWAIGQHYDVKDAGALYWKELKTGFFIRKSDCERVHGDTEL
jgi:hypothetical protein